MKIYLLETLRRYFYFALLDDRAHPLLEGHLSLGRAKGAIDADKPLPFYLRLDNAPPRLLVAMRLTYFSSTRSINPFAAIFSTMSGRAFLMC